MTLTPEQVKKLEELGFRTRPYFEGSRWFKQYGNVWGKRVGCYYPCQEPPFEIPASFEVHAGVKGHAGYYRVLPRILWPWQAQRDLAALKGVGL